MFRKVVIASSLLASTGMAASALPECTSAQMETIRQGAADLVADYATCREGLGLEFSNIYGLVHNEDISACESTACTNLLSLGTDVTEECAWTETDEADLVPFILSIHRMAIQSICATTEDHGSDSGNGNGNGSGNGYNPTPCGSATPHSTYVEPSAPAYGGATPLPENVDEYNGAPVVDNTPKCGGTTTTTTTYTPAPPAVDNTYGETGVQTTEYESNSFFTSNGSMVQMEALTVMVLLVGQLFFLL